MTPERAAILQTDDAAFEFVPPNSVGMTPLLSFRVGHFAVCRASEGAHRVGPSGQLIRCMPWMVMHVASGTQCMDFAGPDAAWRFADDVSAACGERIDHEPATPGEFCAAVPDVVAWVKDIASRPVRWDVNEREFVPYRQWCANEASP